MRLLYVVLVLMAIGLLMPSRVGAQGPTPTITPTPSPTPNNSERAGLSTVIPPVQCATFLVPCGVFPWPIPKWPTLALPSPTLLPTVVVTATPTTMPTPAGATYTPSPTPTKTPIPGLDLGPVNTLSANINNSSGTLVSQGTAIFEVSGTPQSILGISGDLATGVPNLFGTIRGIVESTKSGTFQLISFIFLAMVFVILVYFATAFLPTIISLVKFVLQVIQTLKPF